MALLQRTRILPNQRLDLPDFNKIEDFVCADFKAIQRNAWTNQNFIFSGFNATGVGTNTISVAIANSSLIMGQDDGVLYIGAPSLSALSSSSLSPATTNYIEISVTQDTGGADSRAFWDPTAAGGQGAEFSQIVDTFTFLKASLVINTSNFSGDADKVKVCEVDVNGSGVITAIRDKRDLFFRLGRGTNPTFAFSWASRTEPVNTQFTGADKDIKNFKQFFDAVMDSIREIKGTTYWFEQAPITLGGSFRATGLSILVGATAGARFYWTGTALTITDDSGIPLDSDVIAYVRLFDNTSNIQLTRQEGGNAISIADGEVLWIELPDPLTTVTYDSVGLTATNYRVSARGSVPLDDDVYWLAYREGSRLYLRGLGELDAGEAKEINDETTESLATFLGFDPETATSVPYTELPDPSLPGQFTTASTLVTAISENAKNINFLNTVLNGNPYEEKMDIVAGAPANDNEFTGPVSPATNLSLPLDSRDGNSTEYYIVGSGGLELYLNGIYLFVGDDWTEVGTIGNPSSIVQIQIPLVVGDRLTFRHAVVGGFVGGGGGPVSLQNAYNNGSTILVTPGFPFTVNGPPGKIAVFNGDIDVTGIIDPKGITFSREASDPLPAQDGLWVDNTGDLKYKKNGGSTINISAIGAGAGTAASGEVPLENQTGSTINKLKPIRVNSLGYMEDIDVSIEAEALACVGVLAANTVNAAQGSVVVSGVLKDITTTADYGEPVYVSKTGDITNVKPDIGVGGFVAGDWVIRLGVISRNTSNPTLKDLIVNVAIIGQL